MSYPKPPSGPERPRPPIVQERAAKKKDSGGTLIPPRRVETTPPTREEKIRRRAYELFLERGGEHGRDQEDWFRAEREVAERERGRAAFGK
jgi:hypothetical protein